MSDKTTLVKFVGDYRRKHCPALSIDTILSRPIDALKMGLYVATAQQQLDAKAGAKIARVIDALVKQHAGSIDVIEDVCHAALNARKRGEFALGKK